MRYVYVAFQNDAPRAASFDQEVAEAHARHLKAQWTLALTRNPHQVHSRFHVQPVPVLEAK